MNGRASDSTGEVGMTVVCDMHGPMRWREGPGWWECLGFDGEGCDAWLTDADVEFGISEPGVTVTP